ncbi:MAG: hypothetical protein MPJ50_11775 [Pirellulales bacterium]|nr:hypothetical protein [Pirellulales bacterium]
MPHLFRGGTAEAHPRQTRAIRILADGLRENNQQSEKSPENAVYPQGCTNIRHRTHRLVLWQRLVSSATKYRFTIDHGD